MRNLEAQLDTSSVVCHVVVGPPGTGKTTWLCRQAENAMQAWKDRTGRDSEECRDVLFSSLTRAAAEELRHRGLSLPYGQVRTLHSHAYNAVGRPALTITDAAVDDWNSRVSPAYRLSYHDKDSDDSDDFGSRGKGKKPGDELLHAYCVNRSKMTHREGWPIHVQRFADKYEEWKRVAHLADFEDCIDRAYHETSSAPGGPSVIFVDEAQDHTRSQFRLILKWASAAEKVIVVGDPDQNLYEWAGAEPQAFYELPRNGGFQVLKQSYRVPVAVLNASKCVLARLRVREAIEYLPRDFEGGVSHLSLNMQNNPDRLVEDAIGHVEQGKSVMFLASCGYMLDEMVATLKRQGVPFHNPYAPKRGNFNPLKFNKPTTSVRRLLDYLAPDDETYGEYASLWSPKQAGNWIEAVFKRNVMQPQGKSILLDLPEDQQIPMSKLKDIFKPEALEGMAEDPIQWLRKMLTKEFRDRFEFPMKVVERFTGKALLDRPKIVIGTCHSVKGGESDIVYVSPDMSPSGELENYRFPDRATRLFYVAMTRAKERLYLLESSASGGGSYQWPTSAFC